MLTDEEAREIIRKKVYEVVEKENREWDAFEKRLKQEVIQYNQQRNRKRCIGLVIGLCILLTMMLTCVVEKSN